MALALVFAGCGGDEGSERAGDTVASQADFQDAAGAQLSGAKRFLGQHTDRLVGFTQEFEGLATRYHELAAAESFDLERLWGRRADDVQPLLLQMKAAWVKGNPYYERVEGIVAGTPSLAEYDVILDAGSSASEDPQSAVPFDLTLSDGTVLKQPGNLYNLTEGALWGTLPAELRRAGAPADLDGDGAREFGEVLPDPALLLAASESFHEHAKELDNAGEAWDPSPSDAFTAIVVMVPTISEYFGQWKVSRFVKGEAANAEAFNVVSRLSDIRDILTGLDGEALLSPTITRRVIEKFARIAPPAPPKEFEELSERERDVFRLMARGPSNAEIGSELYISETTVKTHVTHILQKLNLRDRVQAVVLAYQTGLFEPDLRLAD